MKNLTVNWAVGGTITKAHMDQLYALLQQQRAAKP